MKTQALNVNLTAELRRYVKDQVRAGRYQNENEVVRDAIRQMQQREIEQFELIFGANPGAPEGERTGEDDAAVNKGVTRQCWEGSNSKPPRIARNVNGHRKGNSRAV